jgi:FixJ family two-component response regulator
MNELTFIWRLNRMIWGRCGMLNKQIASQLGTTEGTIKVHRGRVMEKMGATSVAALVILAQKAGIAPASADATKV